MKWFVLCLALAGCATAGKENAIIGGIGDAGVGRGDGDGGRDLPDPDASLTDAPPDEVTLTQTESNGVVAGNSLACVQTSRVSYDNTYYRVFAPSDNGVANTLHITHVDFGIQVADTGTSAQQPATLSISSYSAVPSGDTLDPAKIGATPLVSKALQIANTAVPIVMTVPLAAEIPAGTSFIVTLAVPAGNKFFVGTNTGSERKPGYTLAPDCGFTVPTSIQSIADGVPNAGTTSLVMTVTGTH